MSDLRYPSLYQINTRVLLTELSRHWAGQQLWMTFLMPNWTGWQSWVLTGSGS